MPCLVTEPLAQDPRNAIMDLSRVNLFTPLPLPCSALPGAWNWSWGRHSVLVVWAVNMVKITFRTVCKILCRRIHRRCRGVPCWLRVCYTCVAGSVLFRDRDTFFWFHEANPNYLDYLVSKMFHDGIIFNIVVQ